MTDKAHRIRGGIGADHPFWDALEEGEFRLPRCSSCSAWMWPAHYRCGACGSWDIGWVQLNPEGRIYTWTRVHQVSPVIKERADDVPYITLLVEIPEADGARIVGTLHGSEDNLEIGAPVTGVFLPPSEAAKGYATLAWRLTS